MMKRRMRLKRNPWVKTGIAISVGVLSTILLLSCCMFYTTGSVKNTTKHFMSNLIESCSLNLSRSGTNVLGYIDYHEHSVDGNMMVQILNQMIPLNTYIVHADDVDFKEYVQAAKSKMNHDENVQLAFEEYEMDDFMFSNGDIYDNAYELRDNQNIRAETPSQINDMDANLIQGEGYLEDESTQAVGVTAMKSNKEFYSLEQLRDYKLLLSSCYIVDPSTVASEDIFQAAKFAAKDLTLPIDSLQPQVLIYHTHSQEKFYDSRPNVAVDSIVGVGEVLTQILQEEYGINVIHDTTAYDELEHNLAYSVALPAIEKTLQENPTIEVVIDLHRDGVNSKLGREDGKRVALINGEECAQIMLFNGMGTNTNGPIEGLENSNLESNLAFSFQMFMEGKRFYPDLMKPIYLKAYRFNMHLKERYLLCELGTQFNTVEEAKNSMKYLAELLVNVLTKE